MLPGSDNSSWDQHYADESDSCASVDPLPNGHPIDPPGSVGTVVDLWRAAADGSESFEAFMVFFFTLLISGAIFQQLECHNEASERARFKEFMARIEGNVLRMRTLVSEFIDRHV